jgi:hypothetical protein
MRGKKRLAQWCIQHYHNSITMDGDQKMPIRCFRVEKDAVEVLLFIPWQSFQESQH